MPGTGLVTNNRWVEVRVGAAAAGLDGALAVAVVAGVVGNGVVGNGVMGLHAVETTSSRSSSGRVRRMQSA